MELGASEFSRIHENEFTLHPGPCQAPGGGAPAPLGAGSSPRDGPRGWAGLCPGWRAGGETQMTGLPGGKAKTGMGAGNREPSVGPDLQGLRADRRFSQRQQMRGRVRSPLPSPTPPLWTRLHTALRSEPRLSPWLPLRHHLGASPQVRRLRWWRLSQGEAELFLPQP